MLGAQVLRELSRTLDNTFEIVPTARNPKSSSFRQLFYPDNNLDDFFRDVDSRSGDYVVNCIGWIPQRGMSAGPRGLLNALSSNTILPLDLAEKALERKLRVITIGTDCVFSGRTKMKYTEETPLSPKDFYGSTKAISESSISNQMLIRTSIIGQSERTRSGLFEWFRSQPIGAEVTGYSNHFWNGTSTVFFSRVVRGIISEESYSQGVQHLIPGDSCSKAELLEMFRKKLGRHDLTIVPVETDSAVHRTLGTVNPERNLQLWRMAGFRNLPSLAEAVDSI